MQTKVALSELKIGDEIGIVSAIDFYHGFSITEIRNEDGLPKVTFDDFGRQTVFALRDADGYETFLMYPGVIYSITRRGYTAYQGSVRHCWINGEQKF